MDSKEIVEVVKNFSDEIKSRSTKDTLIASYLISFVLYNWRAVIYLFDFSLSSYEKIENINEVLLEEKLLGFLSYNIFIPLLFALLYMFVYTRLSTWIEVTYRRYAAKKAFRILGIDHEGNKFEKTLQEISENHELERKKLEAKSDFEVNKYVKNFKDAERYNHNLKLALNSSLIVLIDLLRRDSWNPKDPLQTGPELEEALKAKKLLGFDLEGHKSKIEHLEAISAILLKNNR